MSRLRLSEARGNYPPYSLNSRLTEAQQENARIQSERAQLEDRTAGLEAKLAKSRSEKNAGDVALTRQEVELCEQRNKLTTGPGSGNIVPGCSRQKIPVKVRLRSR